MNSAVQKKTSELLEAIHASREYRQYEKARLALLKYPEKRTRANEFRKKNFHFQNSPERENAEAQALMYREREKMRRDPVIDNFLTSELVLCGMLRQVGVSILNAAELDID